MNREEKEHDGAYTDDHDDDNIVPSEKKVELTISQKLRLLARKLNRFADSLEAEPSWSMIRKKLAGKTTN